MLWNINCSYFLYFQPIEYKDLRLTILEAESVAYIGKAFDFKCRISNTSDQAMELSLRLKSNDSVNSAYTGNTEFVVNINLEKGFRFYVLNLWLFSSWELSMLALSRTLI